MRQFYGRGRKAPGVMNKLEARYAAVLEQRKRDGDVIEYWYESFKFKLADKTYLTPDFVVMRSTCELEVHETKGFMMDDANVKIKCAAAKFPFRFFVVRAAKGGQWSIEEV